MTNNYFVQQINKLKNDMKYSSLKEDSEMISETSFVEFPSETKKCKMFNVGRKYFQNKSFKIHRKNSELVNKKRSFKNLFSELQNKMQSLSMDIRKSIEKYRKTNTTPTCVTPNRKIRCMLGRTPTKLYSPFSIETPISDMHWRDQFHKKLEDTPSSLYDWRTPQKCNRKNKQIRNVSPVFLR